MPLLETRDLNKRFGGLHVTGDIDFALRAGRDPLPDRSERRRQEHASSASFSASIRRPAARSSIKARTSPGLKPFERIRRGISVKFQVPGIFKALSVRQNLADRPPASPARQGGSRTEEIDRLLDFLKLTEARHAAGRQSQPRPEAMAGDRHGGRPEAAASAARRADRRHVARRDRAQPARWCRR